MVQIQMFILHKNFTKWAAGCTKTFGEGGGGKSLLRRQHGQWSRSLGRSRAEGRRGTDVAPSPTACTRMHTPSLSTRKRGLGWGHVSDLRSPEMGRREGLLPGWLLNTASQTPDTHVARQWGNSKGRTRLQA